jgi:hypothetical protein
VERLVNSAPGSALRFSQPLSGFLAGPSFAALFRAAAVPGIPPFRVFPSQEIAYPSRGSLAPLRLSTDVLNARRSTLSPPVSCDSRAFTRSPALPRWLWAPFSRAEARFPVPLGLVPRNRPFRQLHPLRSFTPPCESVRDWIGFPLTNRPILSWDSSPLEPSLPTPRILDPPRPRA